MINLTELNLLDENLKSYPAQHAKTWHEIREEKMRIRLLRQQVKWTGPGWTQTSAWRRLGRSVWRPVRGGGWLGVG